MTDTKMLQAIASSIALLRQETKEGFKNTNKRIDNLDQKLTKRIDTLGEDLAYLDDDAPTREEHNKLDKRVTKIEKKINII